MLNREGWRDTSFYLECAGGVLAALMLIVGTYQLAVHYDIPVLSDLAIIARGAMFDFSNGLRDFVRIGSISGIDFSSPSVLERLMVIPETAQATNSGVIQSIQRMSGLEQVPNYVDTMLGK